MKKSSIIAIAAACFVGVLAALQADRWLTHREEQPSLVFGGSGGAVPAAYEVNAPPDFRAASKKVLPSVVSVDRYEQVGFFADDNQVAETGTGSGVIVSSDGLIVTNFHVVRGAAEVQVRLPNKKVMRAKVLGAAPRFDIAVLRIEAKGLTPVEMGDSGAVEVGQWVLAVGNPLNFDQTVSVGVVSSIGRSVDVENGILTNAIQTDAAINPGNSGGALTDAQGRLIGINTAIASTSGGSIGIGFAIPVNKVKSIVTQIVEKGYATSAGLGVSYNGRYTGVLQSDYARAQLADIVGGAAPPNYGIIIDGTTPGSSAAQAGMQRWDVLLSVDTVRTDTPRALNVALADKKPGDKVTVKYWSKGEVKTATLALTEIRDQ